MRLDTICSTTAQTLSFEFFPPKSDRAWNTLEDTIDQLAPLGPDFVSVTYGAGGSTRSKTREVIEHIQEKTAMTAMAHLTCVNTTKAEILSLLDEYRAAGIENLLALRGDPPKGQARFTPTDGGCDHAIDLIRLIQTHGRFAVACAAFPEKHPDAADRLSDWTHLQEKFDAGATLAITQCFFDSAPYLALLRHLRTHMGRTPRIIPGILPITSFINLERFCTLCGASIPPALRQLLEPLAHDPVAVRRAGMDFTIRFCQQLLAAGAPGLHIYALNRSTAAAEIVTALRVAGSLR